MKIPNLDGLKCPGGKIHVPPRTVLVVEGSQHTNLRKRTVPLQHEQNQIASNWPSNHVFICMKQSEREGENEYRPCEKHFLCFSRALAGKLISRCTNASAAALCCGCSRSAPLPLAPWLLLFSCGWPALNTRTPQLDRHTHTQMVADSHTQRRGT